MKIFSYGSNMSSLRLKERVGTLQLISKSYVHGYTLRFNKRSNDGSGKANITESWNKSDVLYGLVYEVEDLRALDKAEGYPLHYNKKDFTLYDGDIASVYIAREEYLEKEDIAPYDWYLYHIYRGAQSGDLPKEYLDKISSINFQKDFVLERKRKEISIYGFTIEEFDVLMAKIFINND